MPGKKKPTRSKNKRRLGPQSPDLNDSPLKAYFRNAGILFGISQDAVAERLRHLIGSERFEEWQEINFAKLHGESIGDAYDLMETPEEFATLFSLQADISISVAEWLDRSITSTYSTGRRIIDLGCGSGILAAWLASKYPSSEVVGCDARSAMLSVARSSHSLPNLQFTQWNYRAKPDSALGTFDILLTSFGVDFPPGPRLKDPLSLESLRTGDHYKHIRTFLMPCFSQWRLAASPDASLHAVLRIPDEATFLGAIDAAHEAGWMFDLGAYESISCNNEHFPGMLFRAVDSKGDMPSEQAVRAIWIQREVKTQFATPLEDSLAMCVYEGLANKEILKQESQTYSDGHTMRAIVGRTAGFAFQFSHATTGFARLMLLPISQAVLAEPRFDWSEFTNIEDMWC